MGSDNILSKEDTYIILITGLCSAIIIGILGADIWGMLLLGIFSAISVLTLFIILWETNCNTLNGKIIAFVIWFCFVAIMIMWIGPFWGFAIGMGLIGALFILGIFGMIWEGEIPTFSRDIPLIFPGYSKKDSLYPSNWDSLRHIVYERDGYKCCNCGSNWEQLHAHHIVPLSKGGTNDLYNLITLCKSCHERVHGRHIYT